MPTHAWTASTNAFEMIGWLQSESRAGGKLSGRKCRLFCARCLLHGKPDALAPHLRNAVHALERFSDDDATAADVEAAQGEVYRLWKASPPGYVCLHAYRAFQLLGELTRSSYSNLDEASLLSVATTGAEDAIVIARAAVFFADGERDRYRKTEQDGVITFVGENAEYTRIVEGAERSVLGALAHDLHDLLGPPAGRPAVDPAWLTWRGGAIPALAASIYTDRAFDRLPILADALEEAGCDNQEILAHCRGPGPHVRGCWVVDRLLGKE